MNVCSSVAILGKFSGDARSAWQPTPGPWLPQQPDNFIESNQLAGIFLGFEIAVASLV